MQHDNVSYDSTSDLLDCHVLDSKLVRSAMERSARSSIDANSVDIGEITESPDTDYMSTSAILHYCKSKEPVPCCSFQLPQSADNNTGDKNIVIFSPDLIRPLPKTPFRLIGHNKGRKRNTAVLTDTPEKNALAEEHANKNKESETRKKVKGKGKEKVKDNGKQTKLKLTKNPDKRRVLQDDVSSDDKQEWYCIICCDAYSNSTPGEKCIECIECKNWAHLQCIEDEESSAFVCPNCYSDQLSRE